MKQDTLTNIATVVFIALIMSGFSFAQQEKGGTIRYGETYRPESFDPATSVDNMVSYRLSQLMFESLVTTDAFNAVKPQIASSWKIDAPGSKVTFEINKNAKWHDGKKLTAEDVKFSVDAFANPKSQVLPFLHGKAIAIKSVTVNNEKSVTITLKRNVEDVLLYFADFPIYPKHKFSSTEILKSDPFVRNPVGSGPFVFINASKDNTVVVKKNKNYRERVYLDEIRLLVQGDPDISVLMLTTMGLDMKTNIPPKSIGQVESTGHFHVRAYTSNNFNSIALNFKNPLLQKKEIRQAMSFGFDRAKMLREHYQNKGILISGPFSPSSWAYNSNVRPYPFDQKEAKTLLAKAGCTDSNNDGVLELKGQKLSFTLVVPISEESSLESQVASAFKEYMKEIGIEINISTQDWITFKENIHYKRDFDMAFITTVLDESSNISDIFYSKAVGEREKNIISYKNTKIDNLIDQYRQALDSEKRRTIYGEMHRILADDSPHIFLWSLNKNAAFHKSILGGVEIHPFKFFVDVQKWYRDPNY